MIDFSRLKKDGNGLVPAIVQNAVDGTVLMVAWMNEEAWVRTLQTRRTCFWSRSRNQLWEKGVSSGNSQQVVSVEIDCDHDTVLLKVNPAGPACHTGAVSCFFEEVTLPPPSANAPPPPRALAQAPAPAKPLGPQVRPLAVPMPDGPLPIGLTVLPALAAVIADRRANREEGSYTNHLFDAGLDKILKKVGEESAEVIIAAKNRSKPELVAESSDLLFHWLVLLCEQGVALDDVLRELSQRHGRPRRQK